MSLWLYAPFFIRDQAGESLGQVPLWLRHTSGHGLRSLSLGQISVNIWNEDKSSFADGQTLTPQQELGDGFYTHDVPETEHAVGEPGLARSHHAGAARPGGFYLRPSQFGVKEKVATKRPGSIRTS